MKILNVQLFIDHNDGESESFLQWKTYVEKYLIYGLEQKGYNVKISSSYVNYSYTNNFIFLYLPVFTLKSISSVNFKDRIKEIFLSVDKSKVKTIGLIKEREVVDNVLKLYSEMKVLNTFLSDKDTGEEISDDDLFKKEFLHLFLFRIVDLCNLLELEIKAEKKDDGSVEEEKNSNAVYLAEASKDQVEVRNEIKRELLRRGYDVFPDKNLVGTPKEIEKQVNELLNKCKLSIHIFGKLWTEAASGVVGLELENRVAANYYTTKIHEKKSNQCFNRIIWQPDNLIVSDEKQKKLLSQIYKDSNLYAGAEVISSSIEELKDIILDKLNLTMNSSGGESGSNSEGSANKNVYVVISDKNKEQLDNVSQMVESFGHVTVTSENYNNLGKDYIKQCDSVLFYFDDENLSWLRSKVGEVYKNKSWEYSGTFSRKGIITLSDQDLPEGDIFKEFTHIKVKKQLEQDSFTAFFLNGISK